MHINLLILKSDALVAEKSEEAELEEVELKDAHSESISEHDGELPVNLPKRNASCKNTSRNECAEATRSFLAKYVTEMRSWRHDCRDWTHLRTGETGIMGTG